MRGPSFQTSTWRRARLAVLLLPWLSVGCARTATPSGPAAPAAAPARASFINKVWRVSQSPTVQPGQLYVFLSEGTLVIASSTGTPAFGRWTYQNGALTMIEESIPYQVDILALKPDAFRLRMHNPGEPVEMTLVPADDVPLP